MRIVYLCLSIVATVSTLCVTSPLEKNITDPATISTLYQMAKDTSELLIINNIEYWCAYGTLLGAMRHKGIIPWDDDLDFCIKQKDAHALEQLQPQFAALGYEIIEIWYGYKIFPASGQVAPGQNYKCPFLDIFLTTQQKNKISFICKTPGSRDDGILYVTNKELYPLRVYSLGGVKLLGPNNPVPFLNNAYGPNWATSISLYNHKHLPAGTTKAAKIEGIKLTQNNNQPAQPTGPLYNRVAALVQIEAGSPI